MNETCSLGPGMVLLSSGSEWSGNEPAFALRSWVLPRQLIAPGRSQLVELGTQAVAAEALLLFSLVTGFQMWCYAAASFRPSWASAGWSCGEENVLPPRDKRFMPSQRRDSNFPEQS